MVYLITSNTQKTGLNIPDTTGINNPSSYVNMLSQTFEIEKDSEVAVESLKITRNGNLQLTSVNNGFGIYLGEPLVEANKELKDTLGFPYTTKITGGTITKSPADLCFNIKQGLSQGLAQHPNFVSINTAFPKVELKNGSAEFTGFKYSFQQNLSGEKTNIPATLGDGWVSTNSWDLNCVASASGSDGAVVLKKEDPEALVNDLSIIGQKFPINMANGSVVFTFNSSQNGSAGDLWEVGLTRATFNDHQVSPELSGSPSGWGHEGDQNPGSIPTKSFFDYSVKPNLLSGSFEVYCATYNSQLKTDFKKLKIGGVPNVSLTQGSGTLGTNFKSVKFIVNGDTVDIELISFNGSITNLTPDNSNQAKAKANKTKPVCISNFYMYPKVNIFSDPSASRIMVIDGYDGLDIPTTNWKTGLNASFQYGGRMRGEALEPAILGFKCDGELTYQDAYSTGLWTGRAGTMEHMERRNHLDYDTEGGIGADPDPPRKKLNASGGVDLDIVMITAPSDLYNGKETSDTLYERERYDGPWTDTYGAQNIMGFENVPVQITNTFSTPGTNLAEKLSKTVPKMISNKSLFVRLPDLSVNSFNSGKGSVSKILYHMPRFDNSGNEVGGLYYQPNQRLYIPLGNVDKMRLNNLKVELCNIDETTSNTDLVGQTIICFDIRPRQRL